MLPCHCNDDYNRSMQIESTFCNIVTTTATATTTTTATTTV